MPSAAPPAEPLETDALQIHTMNSVRFDLDPCPPGGEAHFDRRAPLPATRGGELGGGEALPPARSPIRSRIPSSAPRHAVMRCCNRKRYRPASNTSTSATMRPVPSLRLPFTKENPSASPQT